jgi:hypothetical protein
MKRLIQAASFAAVTLIAVTGCGEAGKAARRKATVRGVTYQIPSSEIVASTQPPSQVLFIRIEPLGKHFHLILDSFHPYLHYKLPPGTPAISRLSDNLFGHFSTFKSRSGGVVVRSDGPELYFNCGIEVEDGPVKWGVLFDRRYVPEADEIRAQSKALIQSYKAA